MLLTTSFGDYLLMSDLCMFRYTHTTLTIGKSEGLFAWITANHLLDRLRASGNGQRQSTFATLDMGGASAQISFEVKIIIQSIIIILLININIQHISVE